MMRARDVDPKIKRLFPWLLFLVLAAAFALGAVSLAHAVTCDDVVAQVGMKPLWLAERMARKQHPELTDEQVAWGRQCVIEHRRQAMSKIKQKIEGYF